MKTLMDWLNPAAVTVQISTPEPPGRPDMADVLDLGNLSIEEINQSVLDAEDFGGLPRMEYPLPLEPR